MTSRPAITYRCSLCERGFVALDEDEADPGEVLCACGAPLSPTSLPRGMYELCSPVPDDARPTHPGPIAAEHDLGYGASHGYDATHGGPSGPGDVPAVDADGQR